MASSVVLDLSSCGFREMQGEWRSAAVTRLRSDGSGEREHESVLLKPIQGCRTLLAAGRKASLEFRPGRGFLIERAIYAIPHSETLKGQIFSDPPPDTHSDPYQQEMAEKARGTITAPFAFDEAQEPDGATPAELEASLEAILTLNALTGRARGPGSGRWIHGPFWLDVRATTHPVVLCVGIFGWREVK